MPNPNFRSQAGRSSRDRKPVKLLKPRPRILIVCQGERTEPNYFNAFRIADVEVIHGRGDPLQIIAEAEKKYAQDSYYDQVWCVFDRDDFPQFDVDIARVEMLRRQKKPFRAAWSNFCFELWYLLHFEYLQSGISRERYGEKISAHLRKPYKKNDGTMHDLLRTHEDTAYRNAVRLRKMHEENGTVIPLQQCPMTTVDELVRSLLIAKPANS